MEKSHSTVKRNQAVRIIGGEWRGRLLPVLDKEGLRPTKDMVRETLFNWLQQRLLTANCLDCFAGTGALGFEAISRGASKVVLLEKDVEVAKHLSLLAEQFDVTGALTVLTQAAQDYLQQSRQFDVIFLDPPYQLHLWHTCLATIVAQRALSPDGCIYIEASKQQGLPELPANLHYIKEKKSGQVVYGLVEWRN